MTSKMTRLLTSPLDWQSALKFEKQTKSAIKVCYSTVQPRIIFSNQENSIRNLQRSCTHHSTKYGHISIRVRCNCCYVGRTSLRLQHRINQHILKSIRNNQKPTKSLPKRNCKEKINTTKPPQCDSAVGLHTKQTVRQQQQWPAIFDPCQGKKCISFFSIESHLHQNSKTNSMSPERICLFLQISH